MAFKLPILRILQLLLLSKPRTDDPRCSESKLPSSFAFSPEPKPISIPSSCASNTAARFPPTLRVRTGSRAAVILRNSNQTSSSSFLHLRATLNPERCSGASRNLVSLCGRNIDRLLFDLSGWKYHLC